MYIYMYICTPMCIERKQLGVERLLCSEEEAQTPIRHNIFKALNIEENYNTRKLI